MAIQDFTRTLTVSPGGSAGTTFTVPSGFRAIFKAFLIGGGDVTVKVDTYEVAGLYRPNVLTSGTNVEWGEAGPLRASAGQVVSIVGSGSAKVGINGMLESV